MIIAIVMIVHGEKFLIKMMTMMKIILDKYDDDNDLFRMISGDDDDGNYNYDNDYEGDSEAMKL